MVTLAYFQWAHVRQASGTHKATEYVRNCTMFCLFNEFLNRIDYSSHKQYSPTFSGHLFCLFNEYMNSTEHSSFRKPFLCTTTLGILWEESGALPHLIGPAEFLQHCFSWIFLVLGKIHSYWIFRFNLQSQLTVFIKRKTVEVRWVKYTEITLAKRIAREIPSDVLIRLGLVISPDRNSNETAMVGD